MVEKIDRLNEMKVVKNLSPAQQAVAVKLLEGFSAIDGVNCSLSDGVKVILSDGIIKICGLKVGGGGGKNPYFLTVEMGPEHLVGMTEGDFAVLFGDDCEGTTSVKGAENGGDAVSDDNAPDGEISDRTVATVANGVGTDIGQCLPELDPALGLEGPPREVFAGVDAMDEDVA